MTDPKTKRERAIEAAARAHYDRHPRYTQNWHGDMERIEFDGFQYREALIEDMRAAAAEFERVMSADTVISPLADESTGGPEGGPGWEP